MNISKSVMGDQKNPNCCVTSGDVAHSVVSNLISLVVTDEAQISKMALGKYHAFTISPDGFADYLEYIRDDLYVQLDSRLHRLTQDWIEERSGDPRFNILHEENARLEEEAHLAELGGAENG